MARQPVRANPETLNYTQIRVPGWLKNQIIDHCSTLGVSLNTWLVEVVQKGLREQTGIPEPPPARAPLPTTSDEIRSWALGVKLLAPCGKQAPCPGTEGQTWGHDGLEFCLECGIRVA